MGAAIVQQYVVEKTLHWTLFVQKHVVHEMHTFIACKDGGKGKGYQDRQQVISSRPTTLTSNGLNMAQRAC